MLSKEILVHTPNRTLRHIVILLAVCTMVAMPSGADDAATAVVDSQAFLQKNMTPAGPPASASAAAVEQLLGQMTLTREEADKLANLLELDETEAIQLTEPPYRGSIPIVPPTDPLIYRFYELVQTYGTTWKALIEEEFGDGIMSAIDFDMEIKREENPKGDRVRISMSGKFLPYKRY